MASPRHPQRWVLIALGLAVLTVAGHAAAADRLPDPGALAAAGVLAAALAVPLAQRRRPLLVLAGWLLAAQAIIHVVLAVTDGHGHGHGLLPSPGMLLAHALAGVGVAVVVAWADDVLAAWQRLAHTLLDPITAAPAPLFGRPMAPVDSTPVHLIPQRRGHAWAGRRGPPAALLLSTS